MLWLHADYEHAVWGGEIDLQWAPLGNVVVDGEAFGIVWCDMECYKSKSRIMSRMGKRSMPS
jgi:hypothetical protein